MSEPGPLEASHPSAARLGAGTVAEDVAVLLSAHDGVPAMTRLAEEQVSAAVGLIVDALSAGGRLLYIGAGTSGWLAALDAAEATATFGVGDRVSAAVAGGLVLEAHAMTVAEDDVEAATDAVRNWGGGTADVVLAVSASGRTPYTRAAVLAAHERGCRVVAIVNDPASVIADEADVTIAIPTGAEILSGSTRLTAGLAQKLVLNTVSTCAFVRLGRAFNGQMVCLDPGNAKLRERLVSAISTATLAHPDEVRRALDEAGSGDAAVVMLMLGISRERARERLAHHHGSITGALRESAQ